MVSSESDAHLISKRIATDLCGEACIDSYARSQLAIAEEINRPRWEYFLSLPLNDPLTFAELIRNNNCMYALAIFFTPSCPRNSLYLPDVGS